MKKIVTLAAATLFTIGSSLYAGGDIEPVYEPVITEPQPVATTLSPVYYIGGGVAVSGLSRECPCGKSERIKDMTYGIGIRAGVDFTEYVGLELRYLKTFLEKDFSDMEHVGLYVKPKYAVTPETTLYGLLGYGKTSIDYTVTKNGSTLSKTGISYGAGVEVSLQNDLGFWIDLQHLLGKEGAFDTDLNVGTAGMLYRFSM